MFFTIRRPAPRPPPSRLGILIRILSRTETDRVVKVLMAIFGVKRDFRIGLINARVCVFHHPPPLPLMDRGTVFSRPRFLPVNRIALSVDIQLLTV